MVGDLAPYLDAGARASYPMVLNQIRLGRLVHVVGIRSIRTRKRGGDLRDDSGNSCSSLVVTKTIVFVTWSRDERRCSCTTQVRRRREWVPVRGARACCCGKPPNCSLCPDA